MKASRALIAALLLAGAALLACAPAATPPAVTPIPRPAAPKGPEGLARADLPSVAERLIVRTASVNMVVEDVGGALDAVSGLATSLGGFVVSSQRHGEGADTMATIAIRVPAESFEEAMSSLRRLAVRVTSESTTAQDVTEEYTDLQAQLRNLEATEAQYLRLLERAEKVSEMLEVQRELSNVRGQIERVKGRLQYLERTSATSLITVQLTPAASPAPLVRPGWSPGETAKEALRALTATGQTLASLAIWLGIFLSPVWVVGAVAFLVYWRTRKPKGRGVS